MAKKSDPEMRHRRLARARADVIRYSGPSKDWFTFQMEST
jgi:hypothetical protein